MLLKSKCLVIISQTFTFDAYVFSRFLPFLSLSFFFERDLMNFFKTGLANMITLVLVRDILFHSLPQYLEESGISPSRRLASNG